MAYKVKEISLIVDVRMNPVTVNGIQNIASTISETTKVEVVQVDPKVDGNKV